MFGNTTFIMVIILSDNVTNRNIIITYESDKGLILKQRL